MLVLSWENDESEEVRGVDGLKRAKVAVLETPHGGINLGFEAPKEVSVPREQVWATPVVDQSTEAHTTAHDGLDQWADDGGLQPSNRLATGSSHEEGRVDRIFQRRS